MEHSTTQEINVEPTLLPRRSNAYLTYLDLNDVTKLIYLLDKGGCVELSPTGHELLDLFNTHELLKDLSRTVKVVLLLQESVTLTKVLEEQLKDALSQCMEGETCITSSSMISRRNHKILTLH